jgi:DNA-binding CsgD family transcriptional regulator
MIEYRNNPTLAKNTQPAKRMSLPLSLPGLLLLGPKGEVIACNEEAVNIFSYPKGPGKPKDLRALVASKIALNDLSKPGGTKPIEFLSGRRRYRCTVHQLEVHGKSHATTVFLLDRCPSTELMLTDTSARYNLTARERQTAGYLLHGLTSKEIAQQMNISPNTVKAFMRLVMTKMGVTTRAGIVGRMAGVDIESDRQLNERY